ncbi:MAG: putative porin [Bacteroidota bacterium]
MCVASSIRSGVALMLLVLLSVCAVAQRPGQSRRSNQSIPGSSVFNQGGGSVGPFKDSLLHRTGFEDSVTVIYQTIKNPEWRTLDTTVNDFLKRWPVPWQSLSTGNHGSAVVSQFFQPNMRAGWDHGFHAFDPFMTNMELVPLYSATRPFTQLNYILGSKTEQNIQALHTQNIRTNWNFSFRYNMINVPGVFKNQKNSHSTFLFTNRYLSKKNKYGLNLILAADKIGASENGGLKDLSLLNEVPSFSDRFNIPTNFGGAEFQQQNFLSSNIITGNRYRTSQLFLQQFINTGVVNKDQNDTSTTDPQKGYFRFEHQLNASRFQFLFEDARVDGESYQQFYDLTQVPDTFRLQDKWTTIKNTFNISRFFLGQQNKFLRAGIAHEYFQLDTGITRFTFSGLLISGAGQFQTKNKKWDIHVDALLYAAGYFAGNYELKGFLKKNNLKNETFIRLDFEQVNRTPSFVFDRRSAFRRLAGAYNELRNENTTSLSFRFEKPANQLYLELRSVSMLNYAYFDGFKSAKQTTDLFNVFQLQAGRKFRLAGKWFLYSDLIMQQTAGNAPVNVPLFLTRNRIAFEGRFFKNLKLSTGIELRYNTPFKTSGYSPLAGQFFYQNDTIIRNRPDIAVYVSAGIKRMDLFLRVENLNTFQLSPSGFFRNNFATPLQPLPGLYARFGIFWRFVN